MSDKNQETSETSENRPLVYVPPGAKINVENINDVPPNTLYEKRRVAFNLDTVKNIVRGIYGKRED